MKTILLLPLLFIAAPVMAGSFAPPAGSKAYLTVQSRGCTVSHFYTSDGDAKGDQWRADYDDQGPFYLSRTNSEAEWLVTYQVDPKVKETLDPNPTDPASFTELLATGLDTFDFNLTKDSGEHSRIVGFDKLTGKSVTIDGVELKQTEFEYTQTDDKGTVLRHSKGNEFVSEKWRTFFSGHSEFEEQDGTWTPIDGAPVSFILPGKPGFDATKPIYDCNAQAASFSLPGLPPATQPEVGP